MGLFYRVTSSSLFWFFLCIVAGLAPRAAMAEFLLPTYSHSQTVKNNTTSAANDLHVNLIHRATGNNPTAPPLAPGSTGGLTIDFGNSGATVPKGGSVAVSWQSKFASDMLDPANPPNWTLNGIDVGFGTLASLNLQPIYTDLTGGQVGVAIVNTGAAVNYSGLQIVNEADGTQFTPGGFVAGLSSGMPVSLLVPSSGTFGQGITDIAHFSPTTQPGKYAGGSVLIDGELFAHAGTIPEPSTVIFFAAGAILLLWTVRASRKT